MNFITRLIRHELITGSFYLFLGGMVGNVFAFLLNLFLARNLSYVDYGIFASLLSLITLTAIPANSINAIVVKFVTAYYSKNQFDKAAAFYIHFLKLISLLSLFLIILFSVFSPLISNYLHLENLFYVVAAGIVVVSFFLAALNIAFLQSLLKFGFMALIGSLAGVIKLVVGIALVYLGFRAFAGLWSIFVMMIAIFLIDYIPIVKILNLKTVSKNVHLDKKEILNYAVPAFITVLFLTSFTSTDVILVKHFFTPNQAGFYAGLSLIGKVIFYFTAPISMVMFPLLVKRHATGRNFINLFYLSLLLVILPSAAITTFYFLFPNFVINLFLGGREYLFIAKYLGLFGIYLTMFSLVNVCVNLFLSLNKTKVFIPVVIAAISQIILIYKYHSNFYEVISVSLITTTLLFFTLAFAFFLNYKSIRKIQESSAFPASPEI